MIEHAWVHVKLPCNLSPRHVLGSIKEKLKNRYCSLLQFIGLSWGWLRLQPAYFSPKFRRFVDMRLLQIEKLCVKIALIKCKIRIFGLEAYQFLANCKIGTLKLGSKRRSLPVFDSINKFDKKGR